MATTREIHKGFTMPGDLHVNVALGSHLPSRRRSDLHNSKKVYDYLQQNYPRRVLSWVHDAQWQGPQDVSLDDIDMARRPGGRDDKKVRGIADGIRQGKPMEPVVLVKTPSNDKYEIADGYHRTLAFKHAGKKKLKAHVGIVTTDNGPWERAMHAAKINKRNFNPLEPRDHHGRWILSGLLSDMERVGEHKSSKPHVHRRRRASSRVVVSEVKRLELPGRARPDRVSEAEDYIRQNVPVDQEKYAGLILRLARKGISQDPKKRKEMSDKYNISIGDMMNVENEIYAITFPELFHTAAERRRAQVHESLKGDIPQPQLDAMVNAGAKQSFVYPREDIRFGSNRRLFQATKGEYKGKWVVASTNGILTPIKDSQAKKDLRSIQRHWKQQEAQRKLNLPGSPTHMAAVRREIQDTEEVNRLKKKEKIKRAQDWARSMGFDPDDSYWWAVYWNDNSLIRSQQENAQGRSPVGKPIPKKETSRARRKVTLKTPEISQKEMRGHRPGPRRATPGLDEDATPAKSARRKKLEKRHFNPNELRDRNGRWTVFGAAERALGEMGDTHDARRRSGALTRQTGGGKAHIFDHTNKTLAVGVKPARPNRGNPYYYHGIIPEKDILPRADALYQRNNGATKITNQRLREIWEHTTHGIGKGPTAKELRLIASSRSDKHIDGEDNIKTVDAYGNEKNFARFELLSQTAGKLTPGSGNRRARPAMEQLPKHRQEKIRTKRVDTEKPSKPEMDRYRQQIADDWGDGESAPCVFCQKSVSVYDMSIEKARPARLGGTYSDRANRWPAHTPCNIRAQKEVQADPQEYMKDMMRRFKRLPPSTRSRLGFVHQRFRKYLGTTPKVR